MRNASAEMFCGLAQVLSADAEPDGAFGRSIVGFLGTLARFDNCVVFAYRGSASPLDLFDTFTPPQHHLHVTLYRPGPFRLDPFFQAAEARRLGFWRMRELAPERFCQSDYFRSYYHEAGLAEEVGFFVATDPGTVVVLSLMRLKSTGPFRRAEIEALRACEPTVSAVLARHWRRVGSRFAGHDAIARQPRTSRPPAPIGSIDLSAWCGLGLTRREASIVNLVLQGHSSESAAGHLAIAPGTVKVHRRNVYRKLGISSQAELLATYVDRIVGRGPA